MTKTPKWKKGKDPFSKQQIIRILNGYCPYCIALTEMEASNEGAKGGPTQYCATCHYGIHGMPQIPTE